MTFPFEASGERRNSVSASISTLRKVADYGNSSLFYPIIIAYPI